MPQRGRLGLDSRHVSLHRTSQMNIMFARPSRPGAPKSCCGGSVALPRTLAPNGTPRNPPQLPRRRQPRSRL
ncbi:hypothetical protein MHYP_G00090420 [Metynnis hypsauchen]